MPKAKFNSKLARRALAWIERHPERWDQERWHCGSSYCFAGVVCHLAGGEWTTSDRGFLVANRADNDAGIPVNGNEVHASQRARRLLGLALDEPSNLFWCFNTLDHIRREIERLEGEPHNRGMA